jgi:gamma-glutamyl-gamma-aminobutyrate hydrolase PuuD
MCKVPVVGGQWHPELLAIGDAACDRLVRTALERPA